MLVFRSKNKTKKMMFDSKYYPPEILGLESNGSLVNFELNRFRKSCVGLIRYQKIAGCCCFFK